MSDIRIVSVVLVVVLAGTVSAQVNMEDQRRSLSVNGISGDVKAAYALTLGNSELYVLGISPNAVWRLGKHQVFTVNELERVSSEDGSIINRGFSHLRYNFDLAPCFAFETFTQAQYDKSQDLVARYLAGAGLRVSFIRQEGLLFAVGVAGMFEYEELSAGDIARPVRSSNYVSVRLGEGNRLKLTATSYVQPAVSDWGDLRVLTEIELTVIIASDFSFTHSLSYRYDSEPPAGVKEYDLKLQNGLKLAF